MTWTCVSHSSTTGNVYSRPLGLNETHFHYDRIFNGTADIIWRYVVQETDQVKGATLFSRENLERTWVTLKHWYPLRTARIDDSQGVDALKFVLSEHEVSHCQSGEVVLCPLSSSADVESTILHLMDKAPMEDHHLTTRVLVFPQKDSPGNYDILFKAAHSIADGISGVTFGRTFFDVLASPAVPPPALEERLAMSLSYLDLNPTKQLPPAHQRWRRATARIIFLNRRRQLTGGHAIPNMATKTSYRTPAKTARAAAGFSRAESDAVIANCRAHKVTFGTAIVVISQLAITRMLHRRYLRGDISEEEWEFRRRQPMHFGGPLNLRPYMEPHWLSNGGATEPGLHIDFYEASLPFMPTPFGTRRDEGVPRVDGAPPYSALLSRERFCYRSRMFRQQLQRLVRNPLVIDIAEVRTPLYVLRKKRMAFGWLAEQQGQPIPEFPLAPHIDAVPSDSVMTMGHSSVGQMSLILPTNYPLPSGHPLSTHTSRPATSSYAAPADSEAYVPRPKAPMAALPATSDLLRILDMATYLHARPMEFFLGNMTERHQIGLGLTYDANVYQLADVEEFMEECRQATLYYLGRNDAIKEKL
ncbi:uncharacterized protein BXZ73DRAFT_72957 [Epithele typhae]|uniref:uncharacterized protein n=1 Tax=Epithele typhae TaxID=378194 RepID=UPI00200799D7|nr:uncharacterized protein BXZ73DRAFT_72957 [Epithele typhae]KAH9946117.1 hypothetical protein BXZ73DRAFT_72957 [Epithele typhae]